MTNWKENNYPFKKFTEELTQEWIKCSFSKKETREGLEDGGLQPSDAVYAAGLRDIKKVNAGGVFNCDNEEELKEEFCKCLAENQCSVSNQMMYRKKNDEKDWKDIHSDFTPELKKKGLESGLSYGDCEEGIKFGFKPNDVYIAGKGLESGFTTKEAKKMVKFGLQLSGFQSFEYGVAKRGKKKGFSTEQIIEGIEIGIKFEEVSYAVGLRDIKKLTAKQVLKNGDRGKLGKEYRKYVGNFKLSTEVINKIKNFTYYNLTQEQELLVDGLVSNEELNYGYKHNGLCKECGQPITGKTGLNSVDWCRFCNSQHFQKNFDKGTSGDEEIDKFIQKYQLEATDPDKVLEGIPYEQFENIEFLAEGGFGKVYKAKGIEGPITNWNIKDNKGTRDAIFNSFVVLKILNNSQDIKVDFFQEIANHKLLNKSAKDLFVKCYGISQDPKTRNYMIVMVYLKDGDLRKYLNTYRLSFEDGFKKLLNITEGLNEIHSKGLIHKDLHSGNILIGNVSIVSPLSITDLGLSKPVNEIDDNKTYGVLPYVAPEVLRGKKYTQSSDIYSFGIIVYEILTGLPLYYEFDHDINLTLSICKGLRPNLNELKAPQLLKNLIEQCGDADSSRRPTANQLQKTFVGGQHEIKDERNTEFYQQCKLLKEAEEKEFFEFYKKRNYKYDYQKANEEGKVFGKLPPKPYKTHPRAIYCSRLLDFKNLPEPQNSKKINEIFYKLTDELGDLGITDPVKFNSELEKKFNRLEINIESTDSNLIYKLESEEIPPIQIPEKLTNGINLRSNFTPEQIQQGQSRYFTPSQTQDGLNIGLQPHEHHFAVYLRDTKHLTPETALNQADYNQLKEEYRVYQEQLQFQQEQSPKRN